MEELTNWKMKIKKIKVRCRKKKSQGKECACDRRGRVVLTRTGGVFI